MDDFHLRKTLRIGDRIDEVDGEDAPRWSEEDFEEYLIERHRQNKELLIVKKVMMTTAMTMRAKVISRLTTRRSMKTSRLITGSLVLPRWCPL